MAWTLRLRIYDELAHIIDCLTRCAFVLLVVIHWLQTRKSTQENMIQSYLTVDPQRCANNTFQDVYVHSLMPFLFAHVYHINSQKNVVPPRKWFQESMGFMCVSVGLLEGNKAWQRCQIQPNLCHDVSWLKTRPVSYCESPRILQKLIRLLPWPQKFGFRNLIEPWLLQIF